MSSTKMVHNPIQAPVDEDSAVIRRIKESMLQLQQVPTSTSPIQNRDTLMTNMEQEDLSPPLQNLAKNLGNNNTIDQRGRGNDGRNMGDGNSITQHLEPTGNGLLSSTSANVILLAFVVLLLGTLISRSWTQS